MTIEKTISSFIPSQFPEFYHDEGPNFIAFLTAYYKWMEEPSNILYTGRRLQEYQDVDLTIDQYLSLFRGEYLNDFPEELASNTKFFLKRVLDLYRAKGSPRAYEIFFKAVYDVDVNLYTPGQDMLRLSDGSWIQPFYLEVDDNVMLASLAGERIYGSGSGARATVESYVVKNINNKVLNVLYLSSVQGQFNTGEYINIVGNTNISAAPKIMGSLTAVGISDGGAEFAVGDILDVIGKGSGGKVKVTSVHNERTGTIKFTLINGGKGYTVNATVSVVGGGGTGATFDIGGLIDRSFITVNTDLISPYLLTQLDSANYNFPKVNTPDVEDINTPLQDALTYVDVEIGTIQYLTRIRGGQDYIENPTVTIYDPLIGPLNIDDGLGGKLGNDAVVQASAGSSGGIVTSLQVVESGFGYEPAERLEMTLDTNVTTLIGAAVVRNQGIGQGFWEDTRGFLSDNKYIQDSHYYQSFSYEVQVPLDFDKYQKLLLELVHPIGMALFGKFLYIDEEVANPTSLQQSTFTQA